MRIFSASLCPVLGTVLLFSLSALSSAQWQDRKQLGKGGESTVATDGKGNVYVSCHEDCQVFASHDWGATFPDKSEFKDGFCDMHLIAWPNGFVNLAFIKPNVSGLASYYSADNGKTFVKGSGVDGPLDREWLAPNLVNGELYMDYSHGYIGGPKSTGIYLAASTDGGKTFTQRSRVDKEAPEDYPIDPYLCTASDGRIYAMWSTSQDYNTIDNFNFAYSTDGGKTFQGHRTIGAVRKNLVNTAIPEKDRVDSQERWILGCFAPFGKNEIVAIYPDFGVVEVDGKTYHPLLMYYRVSTDGGATFSDARTVSSASELQTAIRQFNAGLKINANYPTYVQTLPWLCTDPYGRFHVAFQDNRPGQGTSGTTIMDLWQVRFATMPADLSGFGQSELVSDGVLSKRPPLDFLSCAADSKRAYVSWTEAPNGTTDWAFSGNLYLARKIIHAPQ